MDFRQLQYFLSVANHLNFTTAARECFIAQQALSQQIIAIEKELGFNLFYRNNRTVALTPAGEVFHKDAQLLSSLYQNALVKSRSAASGLIGHLNIGYAFEYHHVFFSDEILFSYVESNSDISFTFYKESNKLLTTLLEQSLLDAAFIDTQHVKYRLDQFEFVSLGSSPLYVAVAHQHPFATKSSITVEELQQETLVFPEESYNPPHFRRVMSVFKEHDLLQTPMILVKNFATQLLLTSANKGVTLLPHSAEQALVTNLVFIPLESIDEQIEVCLAWKKDNENPALPFFIKTVADYVSAAAEGMC